MQVPGRHGVTSFMRGTVTTSERYVSPYIYSVGWKEIGKIYMKYQLYNTMTHIMADRIGVTVWESGPTTALHPRERDSFTAAYHSPPQYVSREQSEYGDDRYS